MNVLNLTILALRLGPIKLALTLTIGSSGAEPVITVSRSKRRTTKTGALDNPSPQLALPSVANDNEG